jgi:hypothetical protein
MVSLIQYILAIIIVILFMIGFVLLSVRLRTSGQMQQPPKEQVQLQATEDTDDTDNLLKANNRRRRSLLEIFRCERTLR